MTYSGFLYALLAVAPLAYPLFFLTIYNDWTTGIVIIAPDILLAFPWSIGILAMGPSLHYIVPKPYDGYLGFSILMLCMAANAFLLSMRNFHRLKVVFIMSAVIATVQSVMVSGN